MKRCWVLIVAAALMAGCADEYVVLHSRTGDPLIIARRANSSEGCVAKVREDLARLGVPARHIHVRGSTVGRSLLWPFEPGFACEAAIGPEQTPVGVFPIGSRNSPLGS